MAFTNITDEELVNMGVTGLPDIPGLTTEEMQAQFDEYPQFLKDKFKTHITELEANTAAADIGMVVPESLQDENDPLPEKVQDVVDEIAARVQSQQEWQDAADLNFSPAELNTTAFHADAETVTAPTVDTADISNNVATTEFVNNKMQAIGAGDMAKSVYDPNDRGMVETAYKVGESYVESISTSENDYPVPAANDKIKVVIGKIIKYLSDLKTNVATQLANGMMSKEDKKKLDDITEDAQAPEYCTCSSTSSTAAKVISVTNTDFKLKSGVVIAVKFSMPNTAQNPTFNVNGTGAKSVKYKNNVITDANLSYAGNASKPMVYMYDGTYWLYIGDIDPVYDSALSSSSYNALQNKEVTSALSYALGKIANTDLSDTATRPHSKDEYLIYGSVSSPRFGKCLANIAYGEAFNYNNGGNITSTNVSAEVASLNNDLNNKYTFVDFSRQLSIVTNSGTQNVSFEAPYDGLLCAWGTGNGSTTEGINIDGHAVSQAYSAATSMWTVIVPMKAGQIFGGHNLNIYKASRFYY